MEVNMIKEKRISGYREMILIRMIKRHSKKDKWSTMTMDNVRSQLCQIFHLWDKWNFRRSESKHANFWIRTSYHNIIAIDNFCRIWLMHISRIFKGMHCKTVHVEFHIDFNNRNISIQYFDSTFINDALVWSMFFKIPYTDDI